MKHHVDLRVRYVETDPMGFVYHSYYLVWFDMARTELLRCRGQSYRELEADGIFFPVVDAGCRYLKPARFDDEIRVEVTFHPGDRVQFRFTYEVRRLADGELLAEGHTAHVCIGTAGHIRRDATQRVRDLFS